MKNIINKYLFTLFLLQTFKKESLGTKIYLILRMVLMPMTVFDNIKEHINDKSNILDLGCGYGISSLYLKYKNYQNKILGLDIDTTRIKTLQKITKENQILNLSFKTKNFITEGLHQENEYNTAILVDILHHLDLNTQNLLLQQISKTISTIIIKDIDITPKYKYYRNFFHDKVLMRNDILCFQGSKQIQKELKGLGYKVSYKKINSVFPYPHFLLIGEK